MRIIAGKYKGRSLKTTTGPGYRPAMSKVREALFSMLEARGVVWSETRVLDLFAGSGSLGFEALSRGAEHTTFVELAPYAVKSLRANLDVLEVEPGKISILTEDVTKLLLKKPAVPYSLVFIDPPYKLNVLRRCINLLLNYSWLSPDAIINAEVEARLKIEPTTIHPDLELLEGRAYGQTKVLLWIQKNM